MNQITLKPDYKIVWLLTLAQALIGSVSPLIVFVGSFVGMELSPSKSLATLPVSLIIVGTASFTIPVTLLMQRMGRKKAFYSIISSSIGVFLFASYALYLQSFVLFCISTFLMGIGNACAMQFRFAAMKSVPEQFIPRAASTVLLGGIAAAFIGPEIGFLGKNILPVAYSGSFILMALVFILSLLLFIRYQNPVIKETQTSDIQRPLSTILKQPLYLIAMSSAAIGFGIMSFIMTATPISMHEMHGHSLASTKFVIQSHIVAMFLPSLITPWVAQKIGLSKIMIIGLLSYIICIAIAYYDSQLMHYWIALVLLGIGWNFLFIGGTATLPKAYHPSEKFKAQALNEFVVFGSQALAALSAGGMIFQFGWKVILISCLPIIGLQLIFTLKSTKLIDK